MRYSADCTCVSSSSFSNHFPAEARSRHTGASAGIYSAERTFLTLCANLNFIVLKLKQTQSSEKFPERVKKKNVKRSNRQKVPEDVTVFFPPHIH